jgi:hypothetical protein
MHSASASCKAGFRRGERQSKREVIISVEKTLPLVGARVLVACDAFQVHWISRPTGIWRQDNNDQALTTVIGWVDILSRQQKVSR